MFCLVTCMLPIAMRAQIPVISLITGAAKKVIKAIDLRIQRLQNETIWLQNAQKVIENTMSQLKLTEISDWVDKQKTLYADYFDELAKVKTVITYYQRIRDITEKQTRLVAVYKRSWQLLQSDHHFTSSELDYMASVYTGILDESFQNMEQISVILQSFVTTMSDSKRLALINQAADKVDQNFSDLQRFNTQNALLSLQRANDEHDIAVTKALYGIQ